MSATTSPLGPITRAILKSLWDKLFDPTSPIYLPTIIKNGSSSLGLPSYDPATFTGRSKKFPIANVPPNVVSQACTDDDPIPPVGSDPTLSLGDVLMKNLSNMAQGPMTFSTTKPEVSIEVTVGSTAIPFTLEAVDEKTPNFFFNVDCCAPESNTSNKCKKNWNTSANGQFTAKVDSFTISITAQLNMPPNANYTITILDVSLQAKPTDIHVDPKVNSLPKWAQSLVNIAVQEGVNTNAITDVIQAFLNQPSVKGDMEKLINQELAKIPII